MKLENNTRRIFYIDVKPLSDYEVAEYIKEIQRQIMSSPLSKQRQRRDRR